MKIKSRLGRLEQVASDPALLAKQQRQRRERRLLELVAQGSLLQASPGGAAEVDLSKLSEAELLSLIGTSKVEYEAALQDFARWLSHLPGDSPAEKRAALHKEYFGECSLHSPVSVPRLIP